MASASAHAAALGAKQAKAVLAEVSQVFSDQAQDNACTDLGKMLQLVSARIQQKVIKVYGFSCDREGVLKLTRLVKSYKAKDSKTASLSDKLKALFILPLPLLPHGQLFWVAAWPPPELASRDTAWEGRTLVFWRIINVPVT
ncbi:protein C10-like [Camelus bactrianus]|uniref:Protein C10 n=1 Tax=Camelus bactrianus TaxID=9837 RepID=A0A9W3F683_CAMBA|nr:protein C10-like [Camelus bactrianus]